MANAPMTVVETAEFLRKVKPLLSESERAELVAFIAANPEAGEIIPETGGVRKIRWALPGMGKRGGARVIYYYRSERLPVFLLSAYAKGRKENLSKAEQNAMKRLVPALVAGYPRKA
ncbi:MAG TPA: type II toxin-antitoxin system RelE/ParE family toxin [Bryobacteraceae bacterium]|nr:type II toxin-antitoxin system RelE/ParE family toxin [Bryobacteraceae bacterium]